MIGVSFLNARKPGAGLFGELGVDVPADRSLRLAIDVGYWRGRLDPSASLVDPPGGG